MKHKHAAKIEDVEKEKWHEEEIRRAAKIILDTEKGKHTLIKLLDEVVHWLLLLLVIIGNVIIAAALIFVSGMLPWVYFYITLVAIAFLFGSLIDHPLKDIEKLDKQKHFLTRILMPLLAALNIYIIIGMKNVIEHYTNITFNLNALIAGITYSVAFVLPHILSWLRGKRHK
jgi:hypothetical protein